MTLADLGNVIQVVFAVTTILSTGLAAMLFVSIRTLRESIGDRDQRITGLEGRVTDLERNLLEEKTSHEITKRDLEALGRVVTGETHWVAIEQQINELPNKIVTALREAP